ncbi:MAG TPA: aldehyde dehydrogenase family protein [Bosea sp. (in: a-proteobacteria)]|jgi:betaine-aldehyde dehydrogenase|uniref:aldehyde dehydrogenase family protein n=1 Tax=Bosea sp. (in: a-proteobacteria) TaxID=1871050 RepID=UPI002E10442B|nr:aldehyde dehydrogenase family protein [Bosea sp. (in: a-proteobacteria)]
MSETMTAESGTVAQRPRPLDKMSVLPGHRSLYIDGAWREPLAGGSLALTNPATGASLGIVAQAGPADVDAAVAAARRAYRVWKQVAPAERAKILRRIAQIVRANARELALIDAIDGGNPVHEMEGDVANAAAQLDFFAGLVTEMKGHSVPLGRDSVNFSVREPRGVIGRIIPFNHPFMFCAAKSAAPLAAGNTVIVKPPDQAPLSSLRFAELIEGLLPPGVFSVLPGGRDAGAALAAHPDVAMISLIGSVQAGRAVMKAGADTIKPVLLELGGKNALVALADADPDEVAAAVVAGMNFTWCGQSCGSTSRAFIHDAIHDAVVARIAERVKHFKPGDPSDDATTMGAIISETQLAKVMSFIADTKAEGATLLCGGGRPSDPALAKGHFVEPTVFTGVTPEMRLAREEVFGPVLAVFRWTDEASMLATVNRVEYGLTCSIWTNDVRDAHRLAGEVEAGFVWINEVSRHFLGTPFGGYKQSGIGREECIEELLSYTQEKHIHVNLKRPARS